MPAHEIYMNIIVDFYKMKIVPLSNQSGPLLYYGQVGSRWDCSWSNTILLHLCLYHIAITTKKKTDCINHLGGNIYAPNSDMIPN